LVFLAGCAALQPAPPGAIVFALMGDAPYSEAEVQRFDTLIDDLNARDLAFVAHVGDITSGRGPCTDEWFEARKRQFERIRHAFILLPGDNDWTDCHRSGFDPMERLQKWRALFCDSRLIHQGGDYCEHVRWETGGVVFVAVNVPGSNNNFGQPEYAPRMEAVFAWLDEAEAVSRGRTLLVLMQADPFVGKNGYDTLLERLRTMGAERPGRVFLVHGDTHVYRNDEPLPGLRRVEVWGSPFVGWLRGSISADGIAVEQGGMH
jgi:hypothetical protein